MIVLEVNNLSYMAKVHSFRILHDINLLIKVLKCH
jgi:hypothetical protein